MTPKIQIAHDSPLQKDRYHLPRHTGLCQDTTPAQIRQSQQTLATDLPFSLGLRALPRPSLHHGPAQVSSYPTQRPSLGHTQVHGPRTCPPPGLGQREQLAGHSLAGHCSQELPPHSSPGEPWRRSSARTEHGASWPPGAQICLITPSPWLSFIYGNVYLLLGISRHLYALLGSRRSLC